MKNTKYHTVGTVPKSNRKKNIDNNKMEIIHYMYFNLSIQIQNKQTNFRTNSICFYYW